VTNLKSWIQTVAITITIVALMWVMGQFLAGNRESSDKTRFLICTIVSTPGTPYRWTPERWATICGDLIQFSSLEQKG